MEILAIVQSSCSWVVDALWYLCIPLFKIADRWPNLYWNFGYMTFLFWMYLFHAPFRVHSRSRTDWYAQVTRFMQVWLAVTITLFHLLPRYMERQLSYDSENLTRNPGAVFFPLFSSFSMLLLAEHRAKRAWKLRVTYAPTVIQLFLNAALVSLFLTMHYSYCHHIVGGGDQESPEPGAFLTLVLPSAVYESVHPWIVGGVRRGHEANNVFWNYACPSQFDERPLNCVTHLLLFGFLFVIADYVYKGLRGFDPIRGLLWSETVRVKVHSRTVGTTVNDQPTNPPAMVPWYSTIIAHTAFQLFMGSNLNFLSFDFRGVERQSGPKIFRIHSERTNVLPLPSTSSSSSSSPAAAGRKSNEATAAPQRNTGKASLASREEGGVGSMFQQRKEREKYFYFDWTADVGDGFNSTYEIARLLSQPDVELPRKEAKRLSARKRLSAAVAGVAIRGRTHLHRTLSNLSFSATDDYLMTPQLPPKSRVNRPKRSHSAEHMSGADDGGRAPSPFAFPRQSSASSIEQQSGSHSTDDDDDEFPSNSSTMKLPRGLFVLVGGDLAYPNPTEETYEQRLFGPYKDALGPSAKLRQNMQAHAAKIVVTDETDPSGDVAHIRPVSYRSAKDALAQSKLPPCDQQYVHLRSTPCLFAIPGNHDWIDGLATYRDYILGKSWLGGWYMPQKTSYFILSLPANWYFFCLDTGLVEDIDADQLSYFMDVIDNRLNAASCVCLVCHEPGWIYDSYRELKEPSQKRILKLCRKLGDRLRMRLCGDVHNYSRHTHKDALADAPVLVVSGGGGAFLHGPRNTPVKHLGEPYKRVAAFPSSNTIVSIATRLFGFRIVNWQFDFIGGLLYFVIVLSNFPMPLSKVSIAGVEDPLGFVQLVLVLWWDLLYYMLNESFVSGTVCVILLLIFIGIMEDKLPLWKRVVFGTGWATLHITAATVLVAFLHCVTAMMISSGTMKSTGEVWASGMEQQVRSVVDQLINSTVATLLPVTDAGAVQAAVLLEAPWYDRRVLRHGVERLQDYWYHSWLMDAVCFALRLLDVPEGLAYLVQTVPGSQVGVIAATATRRNVVLYYAYMMWFYWILATPVVSFIVGAFLLVSVHVTDTSYDAAYSAFQIEDYKHFIRFRLNLHTRELKAFVVGVDRVPKVWERDATRLQAEGEAAMPPHLQSKPSTWRPVESWRVPGEQSHSLPRMVDEFVVRPHSTVV